MSLLTYGLPLTLVPLTDDSFVAVLFHETFRHDNRYAYRRCHGYHDRAKYRVMYCGSRVGISGERQPDASSSSGTLHTGVSRKVRFRVVRQNKWTN